MSQEFHEVQRGGSTRSDRFAKNSPRRDSATIALSVPVAHFGTGVGTGVGTGYCARISSTALNQARVNEVPAHLSSVRSACVVLMAESEFVGRRTCMARAGVADRSSAVDQRLR